MITKSFKRADDTLKVSIPEKLEEITLGMMIGLDADLSEVEVISILSGIEIDELYLVRNIEDLKEFEQHVLSLVHQLKYVYGDKPKKMPKTLTVAGEKVSVLRNLSIEPVGAFLNCRNIIAEEINECIKFYGEETYKEHFNPSVKAAVSVLAHYLYCPATGKEYDEFAAEAFEEEVKKLPLMKAIPIATYFFLSYPNLLKPKISYWVLFRQELKRRRALKALKSSGTTTR